MKRIFCPLKVSGSSFFVAMLDLANACRNFHRLESQACSFPSMMLWQGSWLHILLGIALIVTTMFLPLIQVSGISRCLQFSVNIQLEIGNQILSKSIVYGQCQYLMLVPPSNRSPSHVQALLSLTQGIQGALLYQSEGSGLEVALWQPCFLFQSETLSEFPHFYQLSGHKHFQHLKEFETFLCCSLHLTALYQNHPSLTPCPVFTSKLILSFYSISSSKTAPHFKLVIVLNSSLSGTIFFSHSFAAAVADCLRLVVYEQKLLSHKSHVTVPVCDKSLPTSSGAWV